MILEKEKHLPPVSWLILPVLKRKELLMADLPNAAKQVQDVQ